MRRPCTLTLALLLAGCGRWIAGPPAVYGPHSSESEPELFGRVVTAARASGYEPLSSDAASGSITLASHSLLRECRPSFLIRLYRGGWIELRAAGCGVLDMGGERVLMPRVIHREYVGLAARLGRYVRVER